MIILDFGSGNTCRNDEKIIQKMIDELVKIDTNKDEIIIKWQLFQTSDVNVPLHPTKFNFAYCAAEYKGYKTTASVFDRDSLDFLMRYKNIPFIKIANNNLMLLGVDKYLGKRIIRSGKDLCCISKYPATIDEYEKKYNAGELKKGISDHTENFDLYNKYKPQIYEVHYKLEDSTGPDAGIFARTPKQLKAIL